MTTIAYRDGILAADSGVCQGDTMVGATTKIARRMDGQMCAAAGLAVYNHKFMEWFLNGEIGDPPSAEAEDSYMDRGLIFRGRSVKDAQIVVFEKRGVHTFEAPYYAIGSGRGVALGAMHAGASAAEAVAAAVHHDVYTTAPVRVLSHDGSGFVSAEKIERRFNCHGPLA